MSDRLSILTHSTCNLAKAWRADGTISDYDDAKYFTLREEPVDSIRSLSALLTALEGDPKACIIRGAYVGDELAKERDGDDYKPGRVRRALDYFDDQPLHTLLVDIDEYEPVSVDALEYPDEAIAEFIYTRLPDCFHGASYHWQLSNSFGHPTKPGLRAHVWFWIENAATSAELTAWAKSVSYKGDVSLFRTVQAHYTSSPTMEPGVVDPVSVRSGFVQGDSDTVSLDISEDVIAQAVVGSTSRRQRLMDVASEDPVAQALYDQGLVRSQGRDGALNVVCPFVDEHGSGEGAETSTVYYPPNTGGYAQGNFKCLHAACVGRTRGMFLARLGVDEVLEEFEDVSQQTASAPTTTPAATQKVRGVPEAKHLTTDQANAGRIIKRFGKRLIVVAGQWYAWTGKRWEKDDGEVYRYACNLSRIIHAEAADWQAKKTASGEEKERNGKIAEALIKWAQKSEMRSSIESAVALSKKMLAVSEDQIDHNPWLLNCDNGTVDLRTGELKEHDPLDYITKLTPYAYNPEAHSPTWDTVLSRVTLEAGSDKKPLAEFLQRWFGYCATGSTREQVFVVHYGRGSNGKSTILDTVGMALGDYAAVAAPGLVVSAGKDRHPTEIADLFSRRMVTAHETGEGGLLREDFVKQATGGDKLKARWMRADFFEFSPTHKLQLLTNYKPVIKGQDTGIWRRVMLMPYVARFGSAGEVETGKAQWLKDTTIGEVIKAEMEGVLAWIVRGAREWYQYGLQAPAAVMAASKDYQAEQDRVLQFVNECCAVGPDEETPLGGEFAGVYDAYRSWCGEGGFMAMSKVKLLTELERCVQHFAKFEKKQTGHAGKRRSVVMIRGISLLDR